MGGLGNQMFQYAYGRYLSVKFDAELFIDKSFYNNQGTVVREFSLQNFNIKLNNNINHNANYYMLNDSYMHQDIIQKSNYYLNGYWQSEKYFIDIKDIIKEDFKPSNETTNKLYLKYPELQKTCVSLHVRRTDYIGMNGYYVIQENEYYNKAMSIIGDYDYLFIISDDIEWCKSNLKYNNCIYVDGNTDIEDMYLMSLCKHNIIANSSFSWWGAWLNNNPEKKVIAPIKWFGEHVNINSSEIIPNDWIKI
jgi:hypothetical protein